MAASEVFSDSDIGIVSFTSTVVKYGAISQYAKITISAATTAMMYPFMSLGYHGADECLVVEIFCSDHITPETQAVCKRYLNEVKDTATGKYDLGHQLRAIAVLNLENGSVPNPPDAYLDDVQLRKQAEVPFLDQ